ncbi:hypothetical protein GF407_11555 [candidate division KSB1 bacterium]|nr:hypothetical protein [candidate division KSB1 bacterium]
MQRIDLCRATHVTNTGERNRNPDIN